MAADRQRLLLAQHFRPAFPGPEQLLHRTRRPEGCFGNSTVLLLFFFFAFTNIISAAGITEYIARWIVSRKVVQGRPYLLT